MNKQKHQISHEERPIVEFSALVWIIFFLICFALALGVIILPALFLPSYLILIFLIGTMVMVGIFLNPFIAIPIYLIGAYIRPMAFAPHLVRYQLPVIGAFAVLLAWLFHIMVYRDFKIARSKQLIFLSIFTIILIFSSVSYWDYSNFAFWDLAKAIILFFLVANLIKTPNHIKIMIFLMLILGSITALYAVYQRVHGLGESLGGGIIRPTGFEGDPNYLAINLVLIVPFALMCFAKTKKILLKILYSSILILFTFTIMLTYSRAGALGLAAVFFFSAWCFFEKKQKIVYFFIAASIILILMPYIPTIYFERIKSIIDLGEVSIRGRIDGFIVGLKMMTDEPFLGVGLGRWAIAYWEKALTLPAVQTKFSWFPHNIFIEIGSQLGIFALISFFLLLFYMFKDLRFSKKKFLEKEEHFLAIATQALMIGLMGFLLCTFFVAAIHLILFWILAGLSVASKQIAINYKKE
jgi:O-antigen ligase